MVALLSRASSTDLMSVMNLTEDSIMIVSMSTIAKKSGALLVSVMTAMTTEQPSNN